MILSRVRRFPFCATDLRQLRRPRLSRVAHGTAIAVSNENENAASELAALCDPDSEAQRSSVCWSLPGAQLEADASALNSAKRSAEWLSCQPAHGDAHRLAGIDAD